MGLPMLWSGDMGFSLLVLAITAFLLVATKALLYLWWEPRRVKRLFEAQGIKCLPYHPPHGNLTEFAALVKAACTNPMPEVSHDIAPRILPHLYKWSKQYGDFFVHWFGPEPRIILSDPEQAKEILSNKFGFYTKGRRPDSGDLGGQGLATLEGERWAQHRRIMNPAFFHEKLKAMTPTMAACTAAMMEEWEVQVEKKVEIDVHNAFKNLTADIIAHTVFGTSFAEGKQVFDKQHEQQVIVARISGTMYVPGSRFIPTPTNCYRWKLKKEIFDILHHLIKRRIESSEIGMVDGHGDDLLGLMLAANKGELQGSQKNLNLGIVEIVDECKTFFFAGHETTSTLLTWTFLLLATSPEWQERVREEVCAVCGTEPPMAESINQLKTVTMVLNEALRLYPPAVAVFRRASTDLYLGTTLIPAGTVLVVPFIAWHHDKKFWGPNASEFSPDRFSGGIGKASTVNGAFMPFSIGPRNCIGQTFAMLEAKVVLSAIVQRYRFWLSPAYRHAPTIVLTLQPQFGMPLFFEKL